LNFSLSRSSDPVKAHAAALSIVREYAEGRSSISATELESTKSAVIFGIVEGADTKSAAVGQAWDRLWLEHPHNYFQELMSAVLAVTSEQAIEALKTHLMPLFDIATSTLAVVTPLNKVYTRTHHTSLSVRYTAYSYKYILPGGVCVYDVKVKITAEAFGASVVTEDDLQAAFPPLCTAVPASAADGATPPLAKPPPAESVSSSVMKPGFGWANGAGRFCECPRCDKPAPPV
jgi:hypothetical protein